MSMLFAIYGVFAFIFFVVYEVIITAEFYHLNQIMGSDNFQVPHLRIIIGSIFFPITILIAIIKGIVESILDRRGK